MIAEAQAAWRTWSGDSFEPYDLFDLTETWRQRLLDGLTVALCAVENGRIVAVAAAGPERGSFEPSDPSDTSAHLSTLFARPAAHGSGVAQRLHDALIAQLVVRGFTIVRLWVPAGARRARRFYVRNEWEATGKVTTFAGLERLEMRRPVQLTHRAGVVEVKTRVPDREAAESIAAALVAGRFAACAHVRGPIDSWYRWDGHVETSQEWEVDAVTTDAMRDRCTAKIRVMHPYELPALLCAELATSAEYVT